MPMQSGEYCLRFSYQPLSSEFYPVSVPLTLNKLGRICTIRQKTTISRSATCPPIVRPGPHPLIPTLRSESAKS
ncbi:protein of unknown function [Nitrospira defluvii]|uniref:Uncharacterized protein n=1 Tax=Nitrospira defluvii TaxID=330214 RepID=D8P7P8_9BACT|nr:protein of unknown function [Nitrospira defluvii]